MLPLLEYIEYVYKDKSTYMYVRFKHVVDLQAPCSCIEFNKSQDNGFSFQTTIHQQVELGEQREQGETVRGQITSIQWSSTHSQKEADEK